MDLYLWASARCAQKECCRSEIESKLKTKGVEPNEIELLINRLENEGFINEIRYAQAFVADKFRFDHWGKNKIRAALFQKGISNTSTNEALQCISTEDYHEALVQFIQTKRKQVHDENEYARNRKIARAAISRGYEPHLVFDALNLEE